MIKFITHSEGITLEYSPIGGTTWIKKKFKDNENIVIQNCFCFDKSKLLNGIEDDIEEGIEEDLVVGILDDLDENNEEYVEDGYGDEIYFVFASLEGDYYKIDKDILNVDNDLFIHTSIKMDVKFFVAPLKTSIFRLVFELYNAPLYIGGPQGDIDKEAMIALSKNFPNTYELKKYVRARIDRILREHIEYSKNPLEEYNSYVNMKDVKISSSRVLNRFREYEYGKYQFIYRKLVEMLNDEISVYVTLKVVH